MGRFTGIFGLLTMLGLAYVFSTNRRAIRLKTVAWGLGLQVAFAIFVLRVDFGRRAFRSSAMRPTKLLSYSFFGSEFIFGAARQTRLEHRFYFRFSGLARRHLHLRAVRDPLSLWDHAGGHPRHGLGDDAHHGSERRGVAERCRQHLHGTDRGARDDPAVSPELTRSELMTVMTSGMAHVSGSIMAAYFAFGAEPRHVLSAVIMTAPGTILDFQDAGARNRAAQNRGQSRHA